MRATPRPVLRSPLGSAIGEGAGTARTTARFVGDPYVEGTNDDAITIRIRNATIGATYAYTIDSDGGGTPVTDTDTVAAKNFDIEDIDITGLDPGNLSLSYEEDSVEVATDTALLTPPFDPNLLAFNEARNSMYMGLVFS